MNPDLLRQGLELMLAGMGAVFVFLTLLVFATSLMSRLVLRLQATPVTGGGARPPARHDEREREEIAAIAAAIELHRRRR
jgi:oxaloacetate decarboxylase gamma subunit